MLTISSYFQTRPQDSDKRQIRGGAGAGEQPQDHPGHHQAVAEEPRVPQHPLPGARGAQARRRKQNCEFLHLLCHASVCDIIVMNLPRDVMCHKMS